MMIETSKSLDRVLRCEMTAVNQQFIHVLALRDWGEVETADRIMQVDRIDFPNAMQIIDYLVETDRPVTLAAERFTPGTSYKSILVAEQTIERRLSEALEKAECVDERPKALISTAMEPRKTYASWLAERLNSLNGEESPGNSMNNGLEEVFGCLIAMIEQAMVHSFVHWHRGDAENADAAWATSGAAMMHMTEFVHLFASQQTVPVPGDIPPLQIAHRPTEALEFDRELATLCANQAITASTKSNEIKTANLCRKIAEYCQELSCWNPGHAHPAADHNPVAFSSFEATLSRYVWPK